MIGQLRGVVLEKQAPDLLVDVQGVGYELQAPMTTFYHLPPVGAEVVLHTHLAVSETAQQLFGFAGRRERSLFRHLIKVNGVGPRLALAILSGMDGDAFVRCISHGDAAALVKLPGVGKKTAERLVVEMRDRLKDWGLPQAGGGEPGAAPAPSPATDSAGEAEHGLVALGYKPAEAARMVAAAARQQADANSEQLIRLALRSAGS